MHKSSSRFTNLESNIETKFRDSGENSNVFAHRFAWSDCHCSKVNVDTKGKCAQQFLVNFMAVAPIDSNYRGMPIEQTVLGP